MEWLAVWYLAMNLSLSWHKKRKKKKEKPGLLLPSLKRKLFSKKLSKAESTKCCWWGCKWGSHPLAKWRKSWRSSTSHMGLPLLANWGQTPVNNHSHPGMRWDGMACAEHAFATKPSPPRCRESPSWSQSSVQIKVASCSFHLQQPCVCSLGVPTCHASKLDLHRIWGYYSHRPHNRLLTPSCTCGSCPLTSRESECTSKLSHLRAGTSCCSYGSQELSHPHLLLSTWL